MVTKKFAIKQSRIKGFPRSKKGDKFLAIDTGDEIIFNPLKKRTKKSKR